MRRPPSYYSRVAALALCALAAATLHAQPGTGPISGGGGGGGGVTGLTSCADGTALADNVLMRADGTTKCQGSTVTVADSSGDLQWEGTTADAFEGNFTFVDPTADWTWAWGADGTLTAGSVVMASAKTLTLSSALDGLKWDSSTSIYGGSGNIGSYNGSFWSFHLALAGQATQFKLPHEGMFGFTSTQNAYGVALDTSLSRAAAGVLAVGTGTQGSFGGTVKSAGYIVGATSGGMSSETYNTELLTLSTGGATTATAGNLAPANSIIVAILYRVTTAIAASCTAFDVKVTGGNAFASIGTGTTSQGTVTLGTTGVLVPVLHTDQYNAAATTLTVTCNGPPGAGAVRLTTITKTLTPSTT